jgi:hypothetical protein
MLAKKAGEVITLEDVRAEFVLPYNRLNLIIPQKQINKMSTGQFAYIKDDGSGTSRTNDSEAWSATADQWFNTDIHPHSQYTSNSIFERYLREVARLKKK